jgi:hypothetical protein
MQSEPNDKNVTWKTWKNAANFSIFLSIGGSAQFSEQFQPLVALPPGLMTTGEGWPFIGLVFFLKKNEKDL